MLATQRAGKAAFLCSVIRTKGMTDYLYFVLKDKKSVSLQRHQDTLEQQPFQVLPSVVCVVWACSMKMVPIALVGRALWIFYL